VQVENRAGLENLDDILAVEGVDGVFIGPADLAADLGHPGNSAAPEITATIRDMISRIIAAGKAPGILGLNDDATQQYRDWGAQFLAVGMDVVMLARAARAAAARWKED
jgi:4-hydroxy-2-oxoheptanedioate aldolase